MMSETDAPRPVTLTAESIHNPDEPRHFMAIRAVPRRVRISFDGRVLAESVDALRVIEVGRRFYDPVLYLPRADICADLSLSERRSFCPLKGHASYLDLCDGQGRVLVAEIAWSYVETFDFAAALEGRIAFDASMVVIEERGESNRARA